MNVEVASRLAALRKEKGISQEELAEKLGVSRQAVSKWERAESSPDLDNMVALARLYSISLDDLLLKEEPELAAPAFAEQAEQVSQPPQAPQTLQYEYKPEPRLVIMPEMPQIPPVPEMFPKEAEEQSTYEAPNAGSGKKEFYAESFSESTWDDDDDDDDDYEKENASFPYPPVKRMLDGCYPVLVVCAYLLNGFLLNLWHPMWLLFLTIPLYYTMAPAICRIAQIQRGQYDSSLLREVKHMLDGSYPLLIVTLFLVLGFLTHLWHPLWALFLTIPLYYTMMPYIVKGWGE